MLKIGAKDHSLKIYTGGVTFETPDGNININFNYIYSFGGIKLLNY